MKSKKSLIKRFMPLLTTLLVLVLVIAVATPTIAYYIRTAGKVESEYTPAEPSAPSFTLSSDDREMSDVYVWVEDQGYPIFVRVAIIVNWLRLTDCTCTPPGCSSHTCADCGDCPDCEEECTDCTESCTGCEGCGGVVCENCPDCGEGDCENCEGNCEDCPNCMEIITCEDCKNCPDCEEGDCENCEESCTGCMGCEQFDECGVCKDCENCVDRDECPRCNDDPDDDWDVFFAVPVEGNNGDYTLVLGDSWTTVQDSDYYYCTSKVESRFPNDTSELIRLPVLIKNFEFLEDAKPPVEGCILSVEIIVQTIQAIGSTDIGDIPAWQDAWGLAQNQNPFN